MDENYLPVVVGVYGDRVLRLLPLAKLQVIE
jgi:hypothetical protein